MRERFGAIMDEGPLAPTLFIVVVVLAIVVASAFVVFRHRWWTKYPGGEVHRLTPSPSGHLISDVDETSIQAVQRFDPDRGYRLLTYALWWIKAAFQEYVQHSWSLLRHGRAPHKRLYYMGASGAFVARPLDIPQLISSWVSHQTVEAASRDNAAEAQPPATADGLPIDTVDVSVFSPPRVAPGAKFFIQAFVHDRRDLIETARLAARLDKSANRRSFATLQTHVGRGAAIDFFLESADLLIHDPVQTRQWAGRPLQAIFPVELMEIAEIDREAVRAVLHVSVAGVPIGEVFFDVRVIQLPLATAESEPTASDEPRERTLATRLARGAAERQSASPEPVGTDSLRYRNAFISYSRKDFAEVSFFAQGLDEANVEVCIDVNAFEPGDEWAEALPRYIGDADVFYLMWSDNAAGSKWVDMETREAIRCYDSSQAHRPRIKPIALRQPWPPAPEYLQRFHFYSVWVAHRTGQAVGLVRQDARLRSPS